MTRQEQLRELTSKYGLPEQLSIIDLIQLDSNNPEAYVSFKKELSQLIGIDFDDNFGRTLLDDPEIQRAIEESSRNEDSLQ